ncbi:MAG: hypothetical protein EPO22_13645, partial [Dehalococcoidia bacterium]
MIRAGHRVPAVLLLLASAAALATAIALLAGRDAHAAPNLVSNGAFDSGVAGWSANNVDTTLSFDAAAGNPAGSALVQASSGVAPITAEAISGCVDLTAAGAGTYQLAADVLLPTSDAAGDVAAVSVDLYTDAACTTSAGVTASASTATRSNAWQALSTPRIVGTELGARVRLTLTAGTLGDAPRCRNAPR